MGLVPQVMIGSAGILAPAYHYRTGAGPMLPCRNGTFSMITDGGFSGSINPICAGVCHEGFYGSGKYTNEYCEGPCPEGTVSYCESILPRHEHRMLAVYFLRTDIQGW
jgi:hypothetical protein